MFHFQTLDVYKCAVTFLPIRSQGSVTVKWRASCVGQRCIADHRIADGHVLLVRIVSMLTKMIG